MEKKHFFILGAFLMIIAVSESGVVPRSAPRNEASGNGEIPRTFNRFGKDMKWRPGYGIPKGLDSKEFETGVIEEGDDEINENKPEMKPESFNLDSSSIVPWDESRDDDTDVPKYDEGGKPEDEGFLETSDGEEDSDESMDDDKDEDDEKIPKENDDSPGEEPEEDDDSPEEKPEENDDSPGEEPEENDDDNQKEDDKEDKDDKAIGGGWGSRFFNIFNSPSFNFDLIREYSSQLEKAFRRLFRQTADKALQMNGTFTNTTEEEVEIGGKKYIVQKSIISGGDNESSIYIETLSRTKGGNDTEGIQANVIENIERQM